MLSQVKVLDEMDESMWQLLRKNLTGITEQEADWRPHPAANPVRWMIGHLTWFEEWASAALDRLSYFGRYDVSVIELLRTHALHLAGHRFQIRYVRGTYSRAHGTSKSDFDPW